MEFPAPSCPHMCSGACSFSPTVAGLLKAGSDIYLLLLTLQKWAFWIVLCFVSGWKATLYQVAQVEWEVDEGIAGWLFWMKAMNWCLLFIMTSR